MIHSKLHEIEETITQIDKVHPKPQGHTLSVVAEALPPHCNPTRRVKYEFARESRVDFLYLRFT